MTDTVENTVPNPTTDIVVFQPNEVAEFGNKLLRAVVITERAAEDAEAVLAKAAKADAFVDVEMTKAALFLHKEGKVDLFRIYGNKTDSAVLYRSILTEMGVLRRDITADDKVVYSYTDDLLASEYMLTDELKKADEQEYNRRHSRRNALNIRLARICKAAISLFEAGTTHDDVIYRDDENGNRVAVITKAPKSIAGTEATEVVLRPGVGKSGIMKGADFTPSLNGLAKLADSVHKEEPASKEEIESATRKEGETTTTNSEEDFLSVGNTLIMMINGRENTFSQVEQQLLKNLLTKIKEAGIK